MSIMADRVYVFEIPECPSIFYQAISNYGAISGRQQYHHSRSGVTIESSLGHLKEVFTL